MIVIFRAICRRPVVTILGNGGLFVDKTVVGRFFAVWNTMVYLIGRRFVVVLVLEAGDVAAIGIIS